jgi:hypothetical protein
MTEEMNVAGVTSNEAEQDTQECRFPGAIRPEQAVHASRYDREVDVRNRDVFLESFTHPACFERVLLQCLLSDPRDRVRSRL